MHRVWDAEFDEAETVAGLLVAFRNHMGRDWPSENAFVASVERLMERGEAQFLLGALHDDAPPAAVAQVRYRFGIWWAALDCTLEDLFVLESARGAGLGGAMIEAVIHRAFERECRRIELDTDEDNAAAIALYERHGFRSGTGAPGHRQLFMRRHQEL
jgi:ribosomal protein S18 acetylase RimI-like enzyme